MLTGALTEAKELRAHGASLKHGRRNFLGSGPYSSHNGRDTYSSRSGTDDQNTGA